MTLEQETCPHGIPLARVDLVCQHCDALDSSSVAVIGARPERPEFDSIPRTRDEPAGSPTATARRKDVPQQSREAELGASDPETRKKASLDAAALWARAGHDGLRNALRELRATAPEMYKRYRNGRDDDVLERARLFAEAIEDEAARYDPEKEREEL